MKKIFTLIALAFSFSMVKAQDEFAARKYAFQSKISVSSVSSVALNVIIDGSKYNLNDDDAETTVSNIKPGYHSIKIFKKTKGRYNEKSWGRNMQLVYETNLYVKPQYHVDIVINRFGKAFMDEKKINEEQYADNDEGQGGWNSGDIQAMNGRSFDQFKYMIANESFDNTRLTLAKQTIDQNCFSAEQVKEIVQLFGFDNNKLDIAKYSYRKTVDKENYFIVNDAFAFSNSKEELAKYIETCK